MQAIILQVTNTDNCWDQSNSLVSKQLGSGLVPPLDPPALCKPQSSVHPHCGSIPIQSNGSNDLVPSRSIISQDPIYPRQYSSDYSDDGGDLSDESGKYSEDDFLDYLGGDIDSDSFGDSDSTSNASSSKDYLSDFGAAGNLPGVIFTPYECKLFDDSSLVY